MEEGRRGHWQQPVHEAHPSGKRHNSPPACPSVRVLSHVCVRERGYEYVRCVCLSGWLAVSACLSFCLFVYPFLPGYLSSSVYLSDTDLRPV